MPRVAAVSPAPQSSDSLRHRIVHFRLREDEYQALAKKASDAGMSLSSLLRDQADKIYVRNRDDERRRNGLINRLNANLNMIAKWVNTYKSDADAVMVDIRLLDIEQQLGRLLVALGAPAVIVGFSRYGTGKSGSAIDYLTRETNPDGSQRDPGAGGTEGQSGICGAAD